MYFIVCNLLYQCSFSCQSNSPFVIVRKLYFVVNFNTLIKTYCNSFYILERQISDLFFIFYLYYHYLFRWWLSYSKVFVNQKTTRIYHIVMCFHHHKICFFIKWYIKNLQVKYSLYNRKDLLIYRFILCTKNV